MTPHPPSRPPAAWPGFQSPAVGFDQPFDMLHACHDRVRRSLDLLERLAAHVQVHGHDAASRSAAADVLRYFDVAAPLHHEDEERHVLPALRASGRSELIALADRMASEHRLLQAQWAVLRQVLCAWQQAAAPVALTQERTASVEEVMPLITRYATLYRTHAEAEEQQAFPSAAALIPAEEHAAAGAEMASRRRG
jgi:hemerythrin-like domain-containing protein